MREVDVKTIEQNIRDMCIQSNLFLSDDLVECIECSARSENVELAASIMKDIIENLECAKICAFRFVRIPDLLLFLSKLDKMSI